MSDEELTAFLRDLPFLRAAKAADRIEALTEQLEQLVAINEAARADAKEAEAYAEELAKDQVDLCSQLIAAEDKLAKAVDALRKLHHAVCGETGFAACVRLDSGLAYPWPALDEADEMTRATLAEIESSEAVTPYGLEGEKG